MRPDLRPYQREAIAAIRGRFWSGDRSTLLVLATGLGKTVVAAEGIRTVVVGGARVLFLAHRTELLDQAADKLRDLDIEAGIEQGKRRAGDAPVVVASVQTLRGKRLEQWPADAFQLIVADEAHHAASKSYRNVFDRFPRAYRLGITATPKRGDGKSLKPVFESIAYQHGIKRGIDDGWLAPLKIGRVRIEEVDLDGIAVRGGDFVAGQLDDAYSQEHALHAVADPLVRRAGDRPTLVFASGVQHARELAAVINGYKPGTAVALSGCSSEEERKLEIARFKSGERQMLVQCQLFTEGTDLPCTACVALCRPTKSENLYTQIIGRGLRLFSGKDHCLVLDFSGVSTKHRLASGVSILADDETPPEVIEAAEDLLDADEELDIFAALEAAAGIAAERQDARAAEARVKYFVEAVDPFLGKVEPPMEARWSEPTEDQIERLRDQGFKPPETMSRAEADAIIERIDERRRGGLCSPKQARLLNPRGIDCSGLPKRSASRMIDVLKRTGYRATRSELIAAAREDEPPPEERDYEREQLSVW